jgi:hypothetical protein
VQQQQGGPVAGTGFAVEHPDVADLDEAVGDAGDGGQAVVVPAMVVPAVVIVLGVLVVPAQGATPRGITA